MTAAAVHTSAPDAEPDMFGAIAAAPIAHPPCDDLVIEIQGVLVSSAEVRSKPIGDGSQVRPVLCLDVSPFNRALRRRIHVEQIYTEATRKDAEQRAAQLKRGAHITFRTTLVDMRITFPHVQSVAVSTPVHEPHPATAS